MKDIWLYLVRCASDILNMPFCRQDQIEEDFESKDPKFRLRLSVLQLILSFYYKRFFLAKMHDQMDHPVLQFLA